MKSSWLNNMKKCFSTLFMLFAALMSYAQGYADLIKANPAMAAANLMNYHFDESVYTPAPKGYEEFYISHFGRHGSRYDADDEHMLAAWSIMKKADSLGIFSKTGKELFKEFDPVMLEQDGMIGMLTSLGAREHREIAMRMVANFPQVFKGKNGRDEVLCQSSIVPRCIMSMTNFAHSLSANTKGLEFKFVTGQKYYDQLAYHPKERPALAAAKVQEDSIRRAVSKPLELVAYLFADVDKALEIIGDPYAFERSLYLACNVGHLTDHGTCLLKYFPEDILIRNWEIRNPRFYMAYGMADGTVHHHEGIGRRILRDFISRAEMAVEQGNGIVADLRFGHDTGLLPFLGYIGLEGMDIRPSYAEVNQMWNTSVSMCMGSNVQMIFYRNKQEDILVKIMYNEKETAIPALKTMSGPYYKWSELKEYLNSLL